MSLKLEHIILTQIQPPLTAACLMEKHGDYVYHALFHHKVLYFLLD